MKRRLLACVLVLAMILSVTPVSVFATDNTDVTVSTLEELRNNIASGGNIELENDIIISEKLTIQKDVTITGDHKIIRDKEYTGTLFAVNAGATLTLDGGITIDGGNEYTFNSVLYAEDLANWENSIPKEQCEKWFTCKEGSPVATAYMITVSGENAAVNLNDVTIQNHYSKGFGIVSAGMGATVILTGAKITHCANVTGSGLVVNASTGVYSRENKLITVVMNEGTVIDGNHVGGNHGIFKIYMGTYFTMNGGEIKNTTGWNSNGTVVGIYHGVFIMNGGTICSNSSVYGPNNGRNAAVYGHSNHLFIMNDGTICHNSGRSKGGVDSPYSDTGYTGSTIINGGSVVNNETSYPMGIPDVSGGTTLTINGGTFTQNVHKWLANDSGLQYDEITGTYSVTHRGDPTYMSYVSLGDSMSNGYGLDGYNGNTGVEDYGYGSYANQFAEDYGFDHAQLAMSAMRAEDLHWLLEVDYTDPAVIDVIETLANQYLYYRKNIDAFNALWYSVFTNGDYWTWRELVNDYRFDVAAYCIEGKDKTDAEFNNNPLGYKKAYNVYTDVEALQIVAKYYQDSVKDADVISLGMGNGNFGVFAFGRIMEAIGFGDGTPADAMKYDVENAIRECDPAIQSELITLLNAVDEILASKGILADDGDPATVSTMEALYNTFMYATISYALNYAGSVEAILQLNSDAEIILVALMNTIKTNTPIAGEITLGDVMDAIIIPFNAYIAALPTVMQLTDNSVYADATFYYAEADYVEVIVDTYAGGLDDVVRQRFIDSIVGENGSTDGMVWKMVAPMFNGLLADKLQTTGMSLRLAGITLADVKAYEAGMDLSADKMLSCAIYLAFEEAVVAGKNQPVSLGSIMGIGGAMSGLFGGVADKLTAALDFNAIFADVTASVAAKGAADIAAWAQDSSNQNIISSVGQTIGITETEVIAQVAYAVGNELVDLNNLDTDPVATVTTALTTHFTGNYGALCAAEVLGGTIRPVLRNALISDPAVGGLLALFARCVIGNGIGSHPSENGHAALAEAVINTYESEYTAQDKTLENLQEAADMAAELIAQYYDDAYAYAYDYADANGYINTAVTSIDGVIDTLKAIDLSDVQATDAFKAETKQTIDEVIETLEAAKALLTEADMLDQATLDALLALLEEAGDILDSLRDTLVQAGVDVNELVIIPALKTAYDKLLNEVIPEIRRNLKLAIEAAAEYLVEKLGEAYDALVDAVVAAAKKYAPEVDEWLYDYFYNNPAEVIAFFRAYGDDIGAFFSEYGQEMLMVLTFLAVEFGDNVVEYVLENPEEVLNVMVQWVDTYGERAWDMIIVYLNELGVLDMLPNGDQIKEDLEDLYDCVEEQIKDSLGDVYDEIKSRIDTLKQEITDLIAQVKEQLKNATDEAVKETLNQLKEKLENLYDALLDLENIIDAAIQGGINNALAEAQRVLKNIADAAADLAEVLSDEAADVIRDLTADVAEMLNDAYIDAITDEYTVSANSYYVALGDSSAMYDPAEEEYVSKVAAMLGLTEDQFVNLAKEGMAIEDTYEVIEENTSTIAKADLVTIGFGNNPMTEFVAEQLSLATANKPTIPMDWSEFVGSDYVKNVEDILADIKAEIMASGINEQYAGYMTLAIESYAYGSLIYAYNYPQIINAIHEINPDALVIIVGMYNPLRGISVVLPDENYTQIPVGEYVQYLVDLANLQTTAYAMIAPNTIYVDAPDVEIEYTETEMGIFQFIGLYLSGADALYASADGHTYIAEQIIGALDITEEGLIGDANLDGVVNIYDASHILDYYVGIVKEFEIALYNSDVDENGTVDIYDAWIVLEFYVGNVDSLPVKSGK